MRRNVWFPSPNFSELHSNWKGRKRGNKKFQQRREKTEGKSGNFSNVFVSCFPCLNFSGQLNRYVYKRLCKKISCSVYSVHNIIYYDKEQLQNYHKQLLTKLDYTFLASNTPLHIYSAWCGNLELSVAFYCRQWNLGLLMACWKQNIEFKVLPFHVCCKIDKVGCIYKL